MRLLLIAMNSGVMAFLSTACRSAPASSSSARGLDVAFARREHQRRHVAGDRRLGALVGKAAADDAFAVGAAARAADAGHATRRNRAGARARMDVRLVLQQDANRVGGASFGGDHQRGQLQLRRGDVRIDAALEQRADRVGAAGSGRDHQHGLAGLFDMVGVGAMLEQRADHRPVAVGGRQVQGRHTQPVPGGRVSARLQEEAGHLQFVRAHRPMQRACPVAVGGVDVFAAQPTGHQ